MRCSMSRILSLTGLRKLPVLGLSLMMSLLLFVFSTIAGADTITIGLRAHKGIEKSMLQWEKTADYLSEQIPEHKFIMVPLVGLTELMQEAEQNRFDFILTNPSSYVEMELRFGASAILTLNNKRLGKPYSQFGAVIFTRKDNNDINDIYDLQGKKIVAVSKRAFGGWRVAVRELLNHGLDIYKESKQISFSGGVQQDVVSIVRLGIADAGIVRTDMLERMAADGVIKLNDFKVINSKTTKGFPFYHSSQLYPEWPFVKMRGTSSVLSKKVALALLTIPVDHPAALAGKYVGWTVPEDYRSVHKLMQDLKVGPYQHYNDDPVEHFLDEYLIHSIVVVLILAGLVYLTLYIFAINRRLVAAKKKQDKLMVSLEKRVTERTQDLLVAKEHAEEANRAKTDFLSTMSHELRTPLNAVLGFAQLLEHEAEERQLPQMQENTNEILYAGRHLLELINDILDLAKIEAGKYSFDFKPVPIKEVVSEVIRLLEIFANESKVTISCEYEEDEQFEIYADLRSVKQILINIISNAIKYNHPGGVIDIRIKKQKNGYCKFTVTDNGDGIKKEFLDSIFDPFQRVTSRRDVKGSGVGLAITKNLIEVMDGEIQVKSTFGKGSTFTVLFKLAD